jgi:hypothetical protein
MPSAWERVCAATYGSFALTPPVRSECKLQSSEQRLVALVSFISGIVYAGFCSVQCTQIEHKYRSRTEVTISHLLQIHTYT